MLGLVTLALAAVLLGAGPAGAVSGTGQPAPLLVRPSISAEFASTALARPVSDYTG